VVNELLDRADDAIPVSGAVFLCDGGCRLSVGGNVFRSWLWAHPVRMLQWYSTLGKGTKEAGRMKACAGQYG